MEEEEEEKKEKEKEEKKEEEEELDKFMRDCLRLASRWKPSTGSATAGQMVAFQTEQKNSHLESRLDLLIDSRPKCVEQPTWRLSHPKRPSKT